LRRGRALGKFRSKVSPSSSVISFMLTPSSGPAWTGNGPYPSLKSLLAKRPNDVLLPLSRLHFLTGAILDLSAEAGEGPFGQATIM
jgi:hypothetical protein